MFISALPAQDCNCHPRNAGLRGLGFWGALIAAGAQYAMSEDQEGGGGSNAGGGGQTPGVQVAVPTTISTQISPQISPVFIQQDQPQDSPVNAGTAMMPTGYLPQTGAMPGFDAASGFLPTGTPFFPTPIQSSNVNMPLLLGSVALLVGALAWKKWGGKKKAA